MRETRAELCRLERRDWWLWGTAFAVMVLLTLAVFSFSLPAPRDAAGISFQGQLDLAVRGLLGLVLLFSAYAIYQQILIKRLRHRLSGQMSTIAALQTRAEVFQKLAIVDSLTGLCNRRFATENLVAEIARSERHGYALTVLALDIDGLKQVNDRHGHGAGDLLLREFARCLRKAVRSSDVPVRMGGDEFMVVLPECESQDVYQVLTRLGGLELGIDGEKIPVTFSAGWVQHQPGEVPEQLLGRADQALYSDKRTHKSEEQVRKLEEQIRQGQKMEVVGRLAGGVAHDFNNLLTVIQGYSQSALESLGQSDPQRAKVEEIQKAAERAASLTRQLLAFSRKQVLQPRVLDLNAVVANIAMTLRSLIGGHIDLVTVPGINSGCVRADLGQVEQVIMNLAVNARDAMPQGGRLTIEVADVELDKAYTQAHPGSRPGSYVRLAVSDTGVGMTAEIQARIFEPFFTTKKKGRGTGFGLATVYGIVKQSGGYIWVDSEFGQGTTFSVYLPRLGEGVEPAQPAEPTRTTLAHPDGIETVLVVESLQSLRKLICEFLGMSGYTVLEAASGAEAIQIAEKYQGSIHLMLTDVVVAGMSGRALAQCLVPKRPEMKLVYISSDTDDTILQQGMQQGDVAFLQTPFSSTDLSRKVRDLLDAWRLQDQADSLLV